MLLRSSRSLAGPWLLRSSRSLAGPCQGGVPYYRARAVPYY